jgi:hypothetical protein
MAIAFVHQFLRDAGWTEAESPGKPSQEAALHVADRSTTASAAAR